MLLEEQVPLAVAVQVVRGDVEPAAVRVPHRLVLADLRERRVLLERRAVERAHNGGVAEVAQKDVLVPIAVHVAQRDVEVFLVLK